MHQSKILSKFCFFLQFPMNRQLQHLFLSLSQPVITIGNWLVHLNTPLVLLLLSSDPQSWSSSAAWQIFFWRLASWTQRTMYRRCSRLLELSSTILSPKLQCHLLIQLCSVLFSSLVLSCPFWFFVDFMHPLILIRTETELLCYTHICLSYIHVTFPIPLPSCSVFLSALSFSHVHSFCRVCLEGSIKQFHQPDKYSLGNALPLFVICVMLYVCLLPFLSFYSLIHSVVILLCLLSFPFSFVCVIIFLLVLLFAFSMWSVLRLSVTVCVPSKYLFLDRTRLALLHTYHWALSHASQSVNDVRMYIWGCEWWTSKFRSCCWNNPTAHGLYSNTIVPRSYPEQQLVFSNIEIEISRWSWPWWWWWGGGTCCVALTYCTSHWWCFHCLLLFLVSFSSESLYILYSFLFTHCARYDS